MIWERASSVSSPSWASLVVLIASRWFRLFAVLGACSVVVGSGGVGVLLVFVGPVGCGCLLFTKLLSMETHFKPSCKSCRL